MALADVGPEIAEMTVTRGRVIFRGMRSRASALQWEGRKAANLKDKRETRNTRLQAITWKLMFQAPILN